ncbi:MAG TPA: hypothetical protein VKE69_07685, partial [Planctomycetota bacterium]|nr:hypothetical protein [Planctomycetota bacterium]
AFRRAIGILRKQDEHPLLGCVRGVDACRRADEAVPRLRDHERRSYADDARGLAKNHLDPPRILVTGDLACAFRRLDIRETDDTSFGFRDGLLRDHEHVTVLELDPGGDQLGEVVSLPYLGQAVDRDDADLAAQGRPVRRTPACAW